MNLGGTPGTAAWIGLAGISLVLAGAIWYIGREEKRIQGLAAVAGSYGLAVLRYIAFGFAGLAGGAALLAGDLALVASSVLLVVGALQMARVRIPARLLAAAAALGVLVIAWTASGGLDRAASRVVLSALGAAAHLIFAWALYRVSADSRFSGYRIPSALAAAEAFMRLLLPLLVMSKLQSIAVMTGGALYVATAVAFIIALQQTQLAEMRLAKRRALEAKRLAHVVFNNTADLMCVTRVEPDGRFSIEHANRSLLSAIHGACGVVDTQPGRDLEESLRKDFCLSEPEAARILDIYRKAVQTGTTQTFTGRVGPRLQEAVLTPVADGGGRVSHVFYRGTDITEAREAQDALRRSHERFEAIMENAPVGVAITRRSDGTYVYVNPAWCVAMGCSRETLIGRSAVDLGLWSAEERQKQLLDHQSTDGRVQIERAFTNLQGRTVHVVLSALALELDGEPCLVAMAQDVTEAVEDRRRAAELSARFERLFNLSPVPLVVTRFSDGRYLYVNDAWVAFRGCPRERALGMTSIELGIWADSTDRARMVEALKRDGRVLNGVTVFRREDGTTVDSIYSAEVIDWHGERAALIAIQDVTELVKARREAQTSSRRLERLFQSSPVPVLITRRTDGKVLEANRAALEFMGAAREAVIGRTTFEIGIWSDQTARERLTTLLRDTGTVRSLPVQMLLGAGGQRYVLLSAEAIDWKGEEAIVGFQVDVTEMRRATEEIQNLNASLEERVRTRTSELEQALAEMEAFTYSVSHDLRAPLRAMTGFAALLAQRPAVLEDAQAGTYAWRVSRAASRMGQMVDGLLHYAQLGRQPLRPGTVCLAREVVAIAAALDERSEGREVRWEIGPLPDVHADPALLRLALQNVMENAVKYTRSREQARIEVSARSTGGSTEITVRDNGIGFDMAYADKLFAPFERLHDKPEYDGTGIGLAHARRIVERHGGRIWCEATPGSGAAFTLTLPR